MLYPPFDVQDRSAVVVQAAHVVAASIVVLRIEHAISVVSIAIRFIEAVVAAAKEKVRRFDLALPRRGSLYRGL